MAPRLHSNMEMLLVIGRDTQDSNKPKHHLHAFDQTEVESMSSRLFVFNAMWNKEYPDKGQPYNIIIITTCMHTSWSHCPSYSRPARDIVRVIAVQCSVQIAIYLIIVP